MVNQDEISSWKLGQGPCSLSSLTSTQWTVCTITFSSFFPLCSVCVMKCAVTTLWLLSSYGMCLIVLAWSSCLFKSFQKKILMFRNISKLHLSMFFFPWCTGTIGAIHTGEDMSPLLFWKSRFCPVHFLREWFVNLTKNSLHQEMLTWLYAFPPSVNITLNLYGSLIKSQVLKRLFHLSPYVPSTSQHKMPLKAHLNWESGLLTLNYQLPTSMIMR